MDFWMEKGSEKHMASIKLEIARREKAESEDRY